VNRLSCAAYRAREFGVRKSPGATPGALDDFDIKLLFRNIYFPIWLETDHCSAAAAHGPCRAHRATEATHSAAVEPTRGAHLALPCSAGIGKGCSVTRRSTTRH
jgi:hypothetical protein